MTANLVALEPQLIRRVQAAYLDARHRGALDHTAFDAAALTVIEILNVDSGQAREIVARIVPPAAQES